VQQTACLRVQFCSDAAESAGASLVFGARGNGELLMKDAQRYRLNAAECLSAAERCEPPYRGLTLTIAASWLSLARQQGHGRTSRDLEQSAVDAVNWAAFSISSRLAPPAVQNARSPLGCCVAGTRIDFLLTS
jgi:hypothetical protein